MPPPLQSFAEALFARLRGARTDTDAVDDGPSPSSKKTRPFARHDARVAAARVVSRVVGTHRLLLLNFYPYLQRQLAPHAKDATLFLAALVQATHDLVPPDALAPVLRQLVDGFVHDRARPEVAVLGLNTVRELCARAPLIMPAELLQDLALYRKARDKEVAAAARSLVSLFREVAPGLLDKKDRGRGAARAVAPAAYGAAAPAARVRGAELLQAAEARRAAGEAGSDDEGLWDDDDGEGEEESDEEDDDEDVTSGEEEVAMSGEEEEAAPGSESASGESADEAASDGEAGDDAAPSTATAPPNSLSNKRKLEAEPGSLASLRRAVAAARAAKAEPGPGAAPPTPLPIEQGRILDDADFARIRTLQRKALVDAAMAKHGLKSASKRARLEALAGDDADEALAAAASRAAAPEAALDPDSLLARRRGRRDKEERMRSVLEGREGREFGAAAGRRKKKTGGLSNKQQQKRKNLPLAARQACVRKRAGGNRMKRR